MEVRIIFVTVELWVAKDCHRERSEALSRTTKAEVARRFTLRHDMGSVTLPRVSEWLLI